MFTRKDKIAFLKNLKNKRINLADLKPKIFKMEVGPQPGKIQWKFVFYINNEEVNAKTYSKALNDRDIKKDQQILVWNGKIIQDGDVLEFTDDDQ